VKVSFVGKSPPGKQYYRKISEGRLPHYKVKVTRESPLLGDLNMEVSFEGSLFRGNVLSKSLLQGKTSLWDRGEEYPTGNSTPVKI
jgi:hypothetical protein